MSEFKVGDRVLAYDGMQGVITEKSMDSYKVSSSDGNHDWYSAKNLTPVDLINHPPHYTNHPSGIECIQITRHMSFNRGNAIKYIWRAGAKGDEIEDLKKALFCIEDEIKRLEEKK